MTLTWPQNERNPVFEHLNFKNITGEDPFTGERGCCLPSLTFCFRPRLFVKNRNQKKRRQFTQSHCKPYTHIIMWLGYSQSFMINWKGKKKKYR